MTLVRTRRPGQVLVLVSLALFSMIGMVGLTVDLGWMHFVKKSAQAAADAAALAGAERALVTIGQLRQVSCGDTDSCPEGTGPCTLKCAETIEECPAAALTSASDSIQEACMFASKNQFTMGAKSGRQAVRVQASVGSSPPTVPGMNADYWTTVRVSERIPQLFSAILGNFFGTSAARATAVIIEQPAPASFYGLNRENDHGMKVGSDDGVGSDMRLQGGGVFKAEGGMYLASTAHGAPNYSGESGGSARVISDFVNIRGGGTVDNPGQFVNENGQQVVNNGFADGNDFKDPYRGMGNPPAPDPGEPHPISRGDVSAGNSSLGGSVGSDGCLELQPGYYYATNSSGKATGDTLTFDGCVRFVPGASGFGDYVFYGGVNFSHGAHVDIAPGRYILAGTTGTTVMANENQAYITDNQPLDKPANTGGELFVFTDPSYLPYVPAPIQGIASQLGFGSVELKTGNNDGSFINLHGLNSANFPLGLDGLDPFDPVLFWQDPRNSRCTDPLDYSTACAGASGKKDTTPNITVEANQNMNLYGTIHQPRGATFQVRSGSYFGGPLQLITGELVVGAGSPTIEFTPMAHYVTRRVTALVE